MKRTVVNPCGEAEAHHSPRLSEWPVSAGSAALGTGNKEESSAREAFRVNVPGSKFLFVHGGWMFSAGAFPEWQPT
jgi:hypothetical protein